MEYLKEQEVRLNGSCESHNISSDIIESTFGIFKQKKSPNKLYGITPFVLFIPLHAKLENKSATKSFNFKERLCNVKLKDIDAFANEHMSKIGLQNVSINSEKWAKLGTLNWTPYIITIQALVGEVA